MAGGRKPKSSELKAYKYTVVMKEYADKFAPVVARSNAYIRAREALWRSVQNKISAKGGVSQILARQMFMTFWSLYKKGVFDRSAVEPVIKVKYSYLPSTVVEEFLDALYGSLAGIKA